MASNLQELRKSRDFKSARDFAEAAGIPANTYARYESKPEKIPLASAWQLADALGCSIDEVVGREKPDTSDRRGEFQRFYDGLSPENRALMDEFRAFVAQREQAARRRRREEELQRFGILASQYELLMLKERESEAGFGDLLAFGTAAERREAFERFVSERAAEKRAREEGDPEELEARDAAVLKGIMEAYDRSHAGYPVPGAGRAYDAYVPFGARMALEYDTSLADSLFIPFPEGGGAKESK